MPSREREARQLARDIDALLDELNSAVDDLRGILTPSGDNGDGGSQEPVKEAPAP